MEDLNRRDIQRIEKENVEVCIVVQHWYMAVLRSMNTPSNKFPCIPVSTDTLTFVLLKVIQPHVMSMTYVQAGAKNTRKLNCQSNE